jgi:hypothetical protein
VSALVDAAGMYLSLGLSVIALTGKTPNVKVHRHGKDEPLRGAPESGEDWDLLRSVFGHYDTTGVGILTSFPYVVVDIDGEEGALQWADLIGPIEGDVWDQIGVTWVAKTGRGLHLWYATMQPTGTIKLGSKLDLKADGGYVAAPPSKHPDGPIYEWLVAPSALEPPKEVPEPLARRIADHNFDLSRRIVGKQQQRPVRKPRYAEGDTVFFAQSGYDALINAVLKASDGNRNNMLHWAAATMAEEGGIDEDFEELSATALFIGLDPVEVRRTIRSARRG